MHKFLKEHDYPRKATRTKFYDNGMRDTKTYVNKSDPTLRFVLRCVAGRPVAGYEILTDENNAGTIVGRLTLTDEGLGADHTGPWDDE